MSKQIVKNMKLVTTAYSELESIEHNDDLIKHGINTLANFNIIKMKLEELGTCHGLTMCYITEVADWFANRGFNVYLDKDGVNYVITFPTEV